MDQGLSFRDLVDDVVALAMNSPAEGRRSLLARFNEAVLEGLGQREARASFMSSSPFASREAGLPFAVGMQLKAGRLEIVRKIGEGGMGIVYEAFDKKLGAKLALKCAKPGFHYRLTPELLNARKVAHPVVCRSYDLDSGES